MMHGGLAGALGKAYEHAACGCIRRCGFPFYGVSGGRLPLAADLLASRRRAACPTLLTRMNWTAWPALRTP